MNLPNPPASRREAVAAEVRAEMARQRVTAVALAATAEIGIKTLRSRLDATTSFKVDEIDRVAAALGLDSIDLLARSAA